MATAGSLIGSSLSAVVVVLAAASQCGFSGCSEDEGEVQRLAAVSGVVGGAVGSAMVVGWMSATPQGRSFFPSVDVGSGDWRRALVGAAVGTVPGVLVAALGGSETSLLWLAVPVSQGIGAGVAVGLREP
ncbi:hypothetical protein [Rubrivirga sp. IMCC43871]|uniref:hypothetical protein n=1 Tax=Rubrivirga sp. IMCC43871 TaxID=3391575 RepID=UPI00399036A1